MKGDVGPISVFILTLTYDRLNMPSCVALDGELCTIPAYIRYGHVEHIFFCFCACTMETRFDVDCIDCNPSQRSMIFPHKANHTDF